MLVMEKLPSIWMRRMVISGGGDYAWIAQRNNLDLAIGNHGNAARVTVKPSGYVGVGTTDPAQLLHIQGSAASTTGLLVVGNADSGTVAQFRYPGTLSGGISIAGDAAGQNNADFYLSDGTLLVRNNIAGKNIALLTAGGNVGVGTDKPDSRLTVNGDISLPSRNLLAYLPEDRFTVDGKSMGHYALGWFGDSWSSAGATAWLSGFAGMKFFSGGAPRQVITADGRVGIGTTNPQAKLDVAGTTRTDVLQIDAGADLAERFQQSGDAIAEPGTVMAIDPTHPGHLKFSDTAYDTKVAGIVSGAGDIKPGLTLSQEGVLEGDLTVAMAGRVYARCEATTSPIQPGDLLTTSDVPGHCMKAVDKERRDGAMLGKAMTGLAEGTGLVLVLVNLQ